jgi:vancomycin resistance protein VanJ
MVDKSVISVKESQPLKVQRRRAIIRLLIAPVLFYGTSLNLLIAIRRRVRDVNSGPIAFLNSFLHLLLAPSLVLMPLMVLFGRWRAAIRLFNPLMYFWGFYGGMITRQFRAEIPEQAETEMVFSVLSYNIHAEEQDLRPMADVIRAADADVVALQEVSFAAASCFAAEFADKYPYQANHPNEYASAGQAVLSKFPIRTNKYWRHEDIPNALGHQRIELEIGAHQIVMYNVHPVHPGMVGARFDAKPRAIEVGALVKMAKAEALPVIIAGDMNLTDQSDDYARLASRYSDTFREVGRGMGFSFPDWRAPKSRSDVSASRFLFFLPPFMRLDYVFHDQSFRALEAKVGDNSAGSDHRPLFVRLAVKKAEPTEDVAIEGTAV